MKTRGVLAVCAVLVCLGATPVKAQDIATIMCQNYVQGLGSVFMTMRQNGYPISMAENQIYDSNIDDSRMRIYLKKLAKQVYQNPAAAQQAIRNGAAVKECVTDTRGY